MHTLHARATTTIARPIDEVFAFLRRPPVDPAELTPVEDRVTEWDGDLDVGSVCRTTIEIAARELDCITRCVEVEAPRRLQMRLEGDLEGMQLWNLTADGSDTQVQLTLDVVIPQWAPAHLRNEPTAKRWGQMLVEQTLENVASALEQSKPQDE